MSRHSVVGRRARARSGWRLVGLSLLAVTIAAFAGSARAATSYTIMDLGTLGGTFSQASGINGSGQVVGASETTGGLTEHAFSWTQAGGMMDLGTLPGGNVSGAFDVNEVNQVTGVSTGTAAPNGHAFLWTQSGGMVDLGTLGPTYTYSNGRFINNSGQIGGVSYTDAGTHHGLAWTQASGMVDLGTLGGTNSDVLAMNEAGQLAGDADTTGDAETHAVLWQPQASAPTNKDQCKKDGWKTFTNPKFKNQGDCVSYVATHGKH